MPHYPTVLHPDDPVHELTNRGVVGYDDEGLLVLAVELQQEVEDLLGGIGVEVASGFVGPDYRRVTRERAGYGHPLLLAAGELVGTVVGPISQPDPFEHFQGATAGGSWAGAAV